MVVSEIKLYEMLKAKIGAPEAEAFVQILEEKVDKKFEESKNVLVTKEDLTNQISALRAELLRTIYLTSVGQFIAIVASVVGLLLTLLKK